VSGRLKPRLQGHNNENCISVAPLSLPSGTIVCASSSDAEKAMGSSRLRSVGLSSFLQEIHSYTRDTIVDHCWTTLDAEEIKQSNVQHDETDVHRDDPVEILVILTRCPYAKHNAEERSSNKSTPQDEKDSNFTASRILLYQKRYLKSNVLHQSPDEQNVRSWVCVGRMEFSEFCIGVVADKTCLAVAQTHGATWYNLPNLIRCLADSSEEETRPTTTSLPLHIMQNHAVHAMCLVHPYFVAVSGHRLGVWNVDDARRKDGTSMGAIWATVLPDLGNVKVSSIQLSLSPHGNIVIVVSCWNGLVYVYQGQRSKSDAQEFHLTIDMDGTLPCWQYPTIGASSDDTLFPTFCAILTPGPYNSLEHTLLAVSTPASTRIRCYDLDSIQELPDIHSGTKGEVHGILSIRYRNATTSACTSHSTYLVWIDEQDVLCESNWHQPTGTDNSETQLWCDLPFIREGDTIRIAPLSSKFTVNSNHALSIMRDTSQDNWKLEWNDRTIELPFLGDEAVLQLARDSALCPKCRHSQPTSFIVVSKVFTCIFLPSPDNYMYIYNWTAKGWKIVELVSPVFETSHLHDANYSRGALHSIQYTSSIFQERYLLLVSMWTKVQHGTHQLTLQIFDLESKEIVSPRKVTLSLGEYGENERMDSLHLQRNGTFVSVEGAPDTWIFTLVMTHSDGMQRLLIWQICDGVDATVACVDNDAQLHKVVHFSSLGDFELESGKDDDHNMTVSLVEVLGCSRNSEHDNSGRLRIRLRIGRTIFHHFLSNQ